MNKFTALYDYTCQRVSQSIKEALRPFDGIDTVATHGGYDPIHLEEMGCPVVPPITLSTTFQQLSPGIAKYDYSRSGNFSRECLEKCIASLEDGDDCSVFSSGLAALAALVQLLSYGDHIIAFDDLYGGNGRYLRRLASKFGILFTFVDMRDLKLFQQTLLKNTRLVLMETPSNPLMRLVDISAIASITHEFNKEIIVVVDNTFMSSYFQRPLDHGANVVLHSLTKYMNGLESFPQRDIVAKQMHGFSGMITVYLRCTGEQTKTFITNLKLFTLAESLGGYESLIEIPSIMTHASVPVDVRESNRITDNMLRMSIGLEDPKELTLDLYGALDKLNHGLKTSVTSACTKA